MSNNEKLNKVEDAVDVFVNYISLLVLMLKGHCSRSLGHQSLDSNCAMTENIWS